MKLNQVDDLAAKIHEVSTSKGFTPPSLDNLPEKLMLSVSELAEAMEEHRAGKPLYYVKCVECGTEYRPWEEIREACLVNGLKPEGILVEIADATIRNLHMMHSLIVNHGFTGSVSEVLTDKVEFNEGRPAMHGGRAY